MALVADSKDIEIVVSSNFIYTSEGKKKASL